MPVGQLKVDLHALWLGLCPPGALAVMLADQRRVLRWWRGEFDVLPSPTLGVAVFGLLLSTKTLKLKHARDDPLATMKGVR